LVAFGAACAWARAKCDEACVWAASAIAALRRSDAEDEETEEEEEEENAEEPAAAEDDEEEEDDDEVCSEPNGAKVGATAVSLPTSLMSDANTDSSERSAE
jgi:hypothetical protein